MAGIGSTNPHRLARHLNTRGEPAAPWWYCTKPGCDWHPRWPASEHGSARDQFGRHLYELVPRRGPEE